MTERVDRRLSYWCQMCGAAPGDPCTVVSGSGEPGDRPGDTRPEPHFYRSSPHKPAVLIPDEPDYSEPAGA